MRETLMHKGLSMKTSFRVGIALAVSLGVLATAGCSGRSADNSGSGDNAGAGTQVTQFAIVTPEKESDYGWNQQGIWAAQAAAEELGITLDTHENVGYDNTETILTQVAEDGNDLVIAHASGFNTPGQRVGLTTGVPTLVVDYDQNEPGKVGTVITQAQEGGYLAGVAAAKKTSTNTVGIVASAEALNWFLMAGGFAQGVYSVNPDINIVVAYVGPASYGDSAGGNAVASQVIAAGADVIFGMGDGATEGYLQAVETASTEYPISYIATIGDVSAIVDNPDTVLTSVIWNFTDAYVEAITDIEAGTFGTKTYELNVENSGLSLQETPNLTDDIVTAVDTARADIVDGTVTITRATDAAEVQALIDAKGK